MLFNIAHISMMSLFCKIGIAYVENEIKDPDKVIRELLPISNAFFPLRRICDPVAHLSKPIRSGESHFLWRLVTCVTMGAGDRPVMHNLLTAGG